MAELIAADMVHIGGRITVNSHIGNGFDRVSTGDYDFVTSAATTDILDPDELTNFMAVEAAFLFYDSPEVDELAAQAPAMTDPAERAEAYRRIREAERSFDSPGDHAVHWNLPKGHTHPLQRSNPRKLTRRIRGSSPVPLGSGFARGRTPARPNPGRPAVAGGPRLAPVQGGFPVTCDSSSARLGPEHRAAPSSPLVPRWFPDFGGFRNSRHRKRR